MCDHNAYLQGISRLDMPIIHIYISSSPQAGATRGLPGIVSSSFPRPMLLPGSQKYAFLCVHLKYSYERRIFIMLRLHTLLIGALHPLLFTFVVATGCYMSNGSASIDEQWPCNPSAEASICCGVLDYCLGSVMCMDTSADNKLSVQGCTDSAWSAACNPICPGMSTSFVP